jgi:voltage-gated potassium channel
MASRKKAFMFGYSKSSSFVAQKLKNEDLHLTLVLSTAEACNKAYADGYVDIREIDITDDEALKGLEVEEDDYLVCVLEDNHLNVFLTLSLHALFPTTVIIALSDSFHTTQKLKMAGAKRIIDFYQVSANRLHNILHKPVTTKLVDRLLSPDEAFSFREMVIPENSIINGVMVDNFDFEPHKVILIGMIDKRLSNKFLFVTSGVENRFDENDTIVCIGYNDDLKSFEEFIGVKN